MPIESGRFGFTSLSFAASPWVWKGLREAVPTDHNDVVPEYGERFFDTSFMITFMFNLIKRIATVTTFSTPQTRELRILVRPRRILRVQN